MGAKNRSNTLTSVFLADLSKVYFKFVLLIYAISSLLFLAARKASQEHKLKLTYYFSSIVAQLLKRSTICKSPLLGPRSYVDRTVGTIGKLQCTHLLATYLQTDNGLMFRFLIQKNKPTQFATIDFTLWIHPTEDEPRFQFSAVASKKVRAS